MRQKFSLKNPRQRRRAYQQTGVNLGLKRKNRHYQQLFSNKKIGALKASRSFGQRERRRRPFRTFLIIILLIVIFGGSFYFLFFSRVFEVKQIVINHENKSAQIIQDQKIYDLVKMFMKKKRIMIFPQTIIFFFNQKLFKKILSNNEWIEEVGVTKIFPNRLQINLKEYEIIASLVTPGLNLGNFYLNYKADPMNSACAISSPEVNLSVVKAPLCDTSSAEKNIDSIFSPSQLAIDKPLIYDHSNLSIFDQEWTSIIKSVFQIWQLPVMKNHQLKINFVEIVEKEGLLQIRARTNEGWLIYLLPENINQQLASLDLVLKERLKQRSDLQYIDLRFGQKIFYR